MDKQDLTTVTIFNYKIKFWIVCEVVLLLVMAFQIFVAIYFFDLLEDIKEAEKILEIRRIEGNG